ncbi:DUF4245 domain-containing protein [Mycolicibacterium sp. XJ870]
MTTQPTPAPRRPNVVGPAAKPAKSRLLQDGRDMFWSMAPLVVACIVLAGMLGMCSLQASGPGAGPAPQFDAPAALQADAEALKIPVRLPALPEGWQANSGGRGSIDGGLTLPDGQHARAITSRVGYLSPSGMYLSLTQSNADEAALVSSIKPDSYATGAQDVDGVTWVVYESSDPEPVWTTRLSGPAQIAITGAGGTDEYRTLAGATQTQSPLPAHR